mmetsp:Transcript_56948/g.124913  ORF Transcript_56948/g.124913 Transcript_56948/m.124913 type:complete len:250 (-) Transcript_56948:331-1080(-)
MLIVRPATRSLLMTSLPSLPRLCLTKPTKASSVWDRTLRSLAPPRLLSFGQMSTSARENALFVGPAMDLIASVMGTSWATIMQIQPPCAWTCPAARRSVPRWATIVTALTCIRHCLGAFSTPGRRALRQTVSATMRITISCTRPQRLQDAPRQHRRMRYPVACGRFRARWQLLSRRARRSRVGSTHRTSPPIWELRQRVLWRWTPGILARASCGSDMSNSAAAVCLRFVSVITPCSMGDLCLAKKRVIT